MADLRGALEQVVHDIPGLQVRLAVADDVVETPWPTEEDVRLMRDEIDTVRLYLR